jgi:hypothetical protein
MNSTRTFSSVSIAADSGNGLQSRRFKFVECVQDIHQERSLTMWINENGREPALK